MPRRSIHGLTREGSKVVRLKLTEDTVEALSGYPVESRNLLLRTVMRALAESNASTPDEVQAVADRLMADLAHMEATGELPEGSAWMPSPK